MSSILRNSVFIILLKTGVEEIVNYLTWLCLRLVVLKCGICILMLRSFTEIMRIGCCYEGREHFFDGSKGIRYWKVSKFQGCQKM